MNEKNSLTIAYIAFLIISALVYIASIILNFEYTVWKQIVAATTVASYCFSMTEIFKAQTTISRSVIFGCENLKPLSIEQDRIFKKTIEKLKEFKYAEEKAGEIKNKYVSLDENIKEMIQYNKRKIRNCERYIFASNTIGYLLFFCIAIFKTIYNRVSPWQEILTLLAFVFMIGSNYISEQISNNFSERLEKLSSSIQENTNILNETYVSLQENKEKEDCLDASMLPGSCI